MSTLHMAQATTLSPVPVSCREFPRSRRVRRGLEGPGAGRHRGGFEDHSPGSREGARSFGPCNSSNAFDIPTSCRSSVSGLRATTDWSSMMPRSLPAEHHGGSGRILCRRRWPCVGPPVPAAARELIIAMGLGDKSLFDRLEECRKRSACRHPPEELLGYLEDSAEAIDFLNRPVHDAGHGPGRHPTLRHQAA